jgi:putative N-acetyltransferase (TIGR04045 family)
VLDVQHPWGRPIRPFLPKGISAVVARSNWEVEAYYRVRCEIFSAEQGLFSETDRDEKDEYAIPIVALAQIAGVDQDVVGVVRIYSPEPGVFYGGRLGVSFSHRRIGAIGTALITCAVSQAHARGCERFFATVQEKNVKYFERHAFFVLGSVDVCGRPHALMEAQLSAYPPSLAQRPVQATQTGHRAA